MTSTTGFGLSIPQNAAFPGSPSVDVECGRITVLLGANGTGKSGILKYLRGPLANPPQNRDRRSVPSASLVAGRKCVYVEGGRVVAPLTGRPLLSRLPRPPQPGQPESLTPEEQYEDSLAHKLQQRLQFVFHVLTAQADPHKRRYFDAIKEWEIAGRKDEQPTREDTLMDRVFDRFHQVFPEITLHSDPKTFEVSCRKGDETYGVAELSDGEKQVLAMLADLTSCAPSDAAFVVDEPELNLHPLLACRVWDVIEADRPDALFIYGTHCISFAMRHSVETRILLGRRGESAQILPDVCGLDQYEAEEFLGAIPAIAVARQVVVVEGKEESFDAFFYQWLLGNEYKIVPVGSCESVVAASSGAGIWEKIATTVRIGGVVDRDYRAESEVKALKRESLVVLDLHEAESYLCDPGVVCDIAHRLGAKTVSTIEAEDEIIKYAEGCMNRTVFERTTKRAFLRLQLSSGANDWANKVSFDEIRRRLGELVERERQKFDNMTTKLIDEMLCEERAGAEELIKQRNVQGLLAVVPGKELLARLVRLVGLQDTPGFLRSVSCHLSPHEYPRLKELANKLLAIFHHDNTGCGT